MPRKLGGHIVGDPARVASGGSAVVQATGRAAVSAGGLAIPTTAALVGKATGRTTSASPTLASSSASSSGAPLRVRTVSLMFVDATVGWVILGTAGVAAPPAIVP